ncbi:MAG: alpha/beta fold hydrolase [Gemmatimonadota bacterium]|nr:alpha/beta fold hydrolase [Gemmatimonadota bacterium]
MKTPGVCVSAVLAAFALGCAAQEQREAAAGPPSLSGNWAGTADAGAVQLELRLVLAEEEGLVSAPVTSLARWNWETHRTERLSFRLGAPVVTVSGDTISVPMLDFEASYTGTWSQNDDRISGTFTQAAETFPLELERSSEDEAETRRPQTPEEPFPYAAEDVTYSNPDGGHSLAATLTRPTDGGPFPAVILISGSGQYERSRTGDGHDAFLVLADYLTRRGIAVLRYDDRGVGESTGDFSTATTEDFASDVLAGVTYLTTRDDVDPGKIGLAGQSEGGLIAPMAAVHSPDVSYIVLLAGPGVNGERISSAQMELRARANGASEEAIAEILQRQTAINEILMSEADPERSQEAIEAIIRTRFGKASVQERLLYSTTDDTSLAMVVSEEVRRVNTPWGRYFLTYEPAPTLEKVSVPVLAINGTRDLYVPHEENLREIEAALKRGGNTRYEIRALPGINHFLQHAETGTARESETIEETIAVEVLELVGDWIVRVTGG